jgi:hypothetical protein
VGSLLLDLGSDYPDTPTPGLRPVRGIAARINQQQEQSGSRLVKVVLRFGATEVTATAEDVRTRRERQVSLKFSAK